MKITGKPAAVAQWFVKKYYGKRMKLISYHFEEGYIDSDQIWEQFAKQCIAKMRADIDEIEADLLDNN